MADTEHIRWLLEGVESWNRRRIEQDFRPDLEGVEIAEELRQASIVNSNGKPCLNGVNLSEASLAGCNFTATELRFANLRGADLRGSQLELTDLFWANLEGAQLQKVVSRRVV